MEKPLLFRVAILQKAAQEGNFEANTKLIISEMEAAAKNKADILLLPECFLTGYTLPIDNIKAISNTDINIRRICSAASCYKIGIIVTALTKGKSKPQNTAFVISKHGELIMKYCKVHTCDFADESCLQCGDEFKVCDFDGVQLGVMICYDREFPESARILMLKGAEIILVPNDCASMKPRLNALSTRAYENMVGIAMANSPGTNKGNSCAYSPICWDYNGKCIDNTLLVANAEESRLFYADFDLSAIRDYRNHEMMGNTYRKVNAYKDLLTDNVLPPFIRRKQLHN